MKKFTTEQFLNKAKEIHNDKYDYSKVIYVTTKIKVTIICPIHGEFEQLPSAHMLGRGCDKCAREENKVKSRNAQLKNQEEYIQELVKIHGDKLIFTETFYAGAFHKISCICPIHGKFNSTGSGLLTGGCPSCGKQKSKDNQHTKTNKQFISDSNIVHGNKYDYSKANYINAHVKVTIICPEHGEFKQRPSHHLHGTGCSSCTKNGFNVQKQAILYYLKITTDTNQVLYKIGITNRTVNERFNLTDLSKIEIVKQKLYDNGQDALDWETRLKRMYKEYQYKGPDILSSGNTELFTEDIIAMWDSN